VKNKAEVHVFAALKEIRTHLPFPLLGIHSDNGTEFINDELFRYCQQEKLTFTRSRPYRKNDNCYVEQKNYSVVRRAVGYYRYQTDHELRLLNELYSSLRFYTNFFQPIMKLKEKIRRGSQVTKRYDCARTPYQRVLESSYASAEDKAFLKIQYQRLNPVVLKQVFERIQHKIMKHLRAKGEEELKNENIAGQPNDFSYKLNEATNVCFR
jgi:hypothetical protein